MTQIYETREQRDFSDLISKDEFEKAIRNDLPRRAKFSERYKILRDELYEIVYSQLRNMFNWESFQDMYPYIDVSNNMMRRVIKETSTVYKDQHTRGVTPKGSQKIYEELITELRLNETLQRANFYVNGLNDLVLMVSAIGGKVGVNMYTPDRIVPFQNEDNPTMLDGLAIEDSIQELDGTRKALYYIWTPTRHFVLDHNYNIRHVMGNEQMLNPYIKVNMEQSAFYPFVFAHSTARETSFFDKHTGNDLVEGTRMISIQETFRNFMVPMQFKQLAVKKNVDDNQSLKSMQVKSPLHVLQTSGDTHVLDWQSDIDKLGNAIEKKIFSIANAYGISAENFKLSAQATSGFARMIAKERLSELRSEQIKVWRGVEECIFNAIRECKKLYKIGKPIADNAKFSIDYKDAQYADDPLSEMQLLREKMEMGLINILDVVRNENPDIKTDEEAITVLQKNLEIKRMVTSKMPSLNINTAQLVPRNGEGGQANARGNAK